MKSFYFTGYYKTWQSVATIYDSSDYYILWQHVITIYDGYVITIRHLLLHFTTGITIHDKCNYNSWQVLQFTTLLHFTTVQEYPPTPPPPWSFSKPTLKSVSIFLNFCPIVPSFVFTALAKYSFTVFKWLSLYFTEFDDHCVKIWLKSATWFPTQMNRNQILHRDYRVILNVTSMSVIGFSDRFVTLERGKT